MIPLYTGRKNQDRKAEEVCSIIRDTNTASQKVAVRNGMIRADSWTKHYRGVDMPHVRYVIRRCDLKKTG